MHYKFIMVGTVYKKVDHSAIILNTCAAINTGTPLQEYQQTLTYINTHDCFLRSIQVIDDYVTLQTNAKQSKVVKKRVKAEASISIK